MAELVITDISKRFGNSDAVEVLSGVSFSAVNGDTIAIVGPSGSGKSTLLNIIGSLDKPDSGNVVSDGVVVNELEGEALSRFRALNVGFVFQDHHLLGQLNALENVMMPTLPIQVDYDPRTRARQLLDRMGMGDKIRDYPSTLSGGERQRVALARALINRPGLLLCDEPTGSLDSETGTDIMSLLMGLASENKVTVIVVTHNLEQAAKLSRKLQLKKGKLTEIDI